MDFDSLKNQVSNLTLYDVKAGFRKAQNAVMNYTEMEAKVREATNNEPWGASTSTMQEIANGTFSYATLSEIMPMIYKRFTEKTAEEWRQIYKALQLLEFLIKNGSERVIDDARSHLSLLKMLRQFHFIDMNGKDQGVNVRNRAKELAELLADVDRIRQERKKARQTRGKYAGVEGGAGIGGSGSSRYGGFGSEAPAGSTQFGGYSGGVYGDGGGFGGDTGGDEYTGTQDRREHFEEYDEYNEPASAGPTRQRTTASTRSKPAPPKPKTPEVDLFDFSDDPGPLAAPVSNGKQPATMNAADDFGSFSSSTAEVDDDFDDFQSATTTSAIPPPTSTFTTTSTTQFAQPKPMGGSSQGINSIISTISPPPSGTTTPMANYSGFKSPPPSQQQQQQRQPMQSLMPSFSPAQPKVANYQASTPNYFGSIPVSSSTPTSSQSGPTKTAAATKPAASKIAPGSDPFAMLSAGSSKKGGAAQGKAPSMADMAKQKSAAGIWGASTTQSQSLQRQQPGGSSGGDDLLGL